MSIPRLRFAGCLAGYPHMRPILAPAPSLSNPLCHQSSVAAYLSVVCSCPYHLPSQPNVTIRRSSVASQCGLRARLRPKRTHIALLPSLQSTLALFELISTPEPGLYLLQSSLRPLSDYSVYSRRQLCKMANVYTHLSSCIGLSAQGLSSPQMR